jgi:hypothetical protein
MERQLSQVKGHSVATTGVSYSWSTGDTNQGRIVTCLLALGHTQSEVYDPVSDLSLAG